VERKVEVNYNNKGMPYIYLNIDLELLGLTRPSSDDVNFVAPSASG